MKKWRNEYGMKKMTKQRNDGMKKWSGDCVKLVKRMNDKQNQSELMFYIWCTCRIKKYYILRNEETKKRYYILRNEETKERKRNEENEEMF